MNQKILGIIGVAISLSCFLFYFFKRERIRKAGFNVTGEIIGFDTDSGDKYAIIRFKTLSGEIIEKKYHEEAGFRPKIGDQVPIVYNPTDPGNFYINSYWGKFGFLLAIAICIIVLLGSVLLLK